MNHRSPANAEQDRYKENVTKHIMVKLLNLKDKTILKVEALFLLVKNWILPSYPSIEKME